jgi:outer membrane protein assembly factor BamB
MTVPAVDKKALRLWPGVVIIGLQCLFSYVIPRVVPDTELIGVLAGPAGGLAVILWWLLFSRAPWPERLSAAALMAAALFAISRIVHVSISTGAMGMLFPLLVLPILGIAFVLWAVVSRRFSGGLRFATMAAAILLGCGWGALVRTGGFTGSGRNDLHWRWTPTPEERLLAESRNGPAALPPAPATPPEKPAAGEVKPESEPVKATTPEKPLAAASIPPAAPAPKVEIEVDWPGFRGANRDDLVRGVKIQTDWNASPPVVLWRRPIGPGCSCV